MSDYGPGGRATPGPLYCCGLSLFSARVPAAPFLVYRALTRRPYGHGCGGDSVVRMSVVKAETDAGAAPGRPADGRSPFVRLAELLAEVKPGKNPINLAVGEPQHPIPAFVGPVIAAHLADFGRYPAGKGTERFRRAAADWLSRRYRLDRSP